jgi:hypothetical protein
MTSALKNLRIIGLAPPIDVESAAEEMQAPEMPLTSQLRSLSGNFGRRPV